MHNVPYGNVFDVQDNGRAKKKLISKEEVKHQNSFSIRGKMAYSLFRGVNRITILELGACSFLRFFAMMKSNVLRIDCRHGT